MLIRAASLDPEPPFRSRSPNARELFPERTALSTLCGSGSLAATHFPPLMTVVRRFFEDVANVIDLGKMSSPLAKNESAILRIMVFGAPAPCDVSSGCVTL